MSTLETNNSIFQPDIGTIHIPPPVFQAVHPRPCHQIALHKHQFALQLIKESTRCLVMCLTINSIDSTRLHQKPKMLQQNAKVALLYHKIQLLDIYFGQF